MFEQQIRESGKFSSFLLHFLIASIGTLLITVILSFLLSFVAPRNVVSMLALGPSFSIPILAGVLLG